MSKDAFKAVVVAQAGENGSIDGEGDSGPAGPLTAETPNQFGSEVLRVSGTTTITTDKHFATSLQCTNNFFCYNDDIWSQRCGLTENFAAFDKFGDGPLFRYALTL